MLTLVVGAASSVGGKDWSRVNFHIILSMLFCKEAEKDRWLSPRIFLGASHANFFCYPNSFIVRDQTLGVKGLSGGGKWLQRVPPVGERQHNY